MPCICETQEQATWRVLIVRIILNNGGALAGFTNISLANISLNGTFERMPTELKGSGCKALAYLVDRAH